MKNRFLFVFLIFCYAQIFWGGKVWGQTYTTTGKSTDWNSPEAWIIDSSPCSPISTSNGSPPPPLALNPGMACNVKFIIEHPITYTGSTIIGGGYIDSLIIKIGGHLTFTGDLTINGTGNKQAGPFAIKVIGGNLSINGTYSHRNEATLEIIQNGKVIIGNSFDANNYNGGKILVDASSSLIVKNSINININNPFQIYGNLEATDLNTGSGGGIQFLGNSIIRISNNLNLTNGTITGSENSDIRVGNDFNMSGGGKYIGKDNTYVEVNGNHNINSYNPVNLSNSAQVFIHGNTIGGVNLSVIDNACYKSINLSGGSACVLCGETYTADGTFYVPANVYEITIEAWGGGAAGGSGTIKTGGGGGGGYSRRVLSVTPGQPFAVYIGKGGIANDPLASNRDGTLSYVSINSSEPLPDRVTNSIIFANGGKSPNPVTSAGTGGLAISASELSTRPTSFSFKGGNGRSASGNGGGGGSAASNNGPGNNGQDPNGGSQPIGKGGPGGQGGYNGNAGKPPAFGTYGGGGGGAAGNGTPLKGGNGAGGLVVISFSCPTKEPCSRVVDYGTNGDYYIVEYYCDGTWEAPEGLKEFGITAIGGGGGGGFGNSSNGGSGGEIFSTPNSGIYSSINNNNGKEIGFPANTNFDVQVGLGGTGATSTDNSTNGEESKVLGSFTDYAGNLISYSPTALGGFGNSVTSTQNGKQIPSSIDLNNRPALQGYYGPSGGGTSATAGSNGGGIYNGSGTNKNGTANSGAGGGAGTTGGGNGGSGKVFIYYPLYRILPVEYLYFNATYQKQTKSSLLEWSTAKEWENSHFEIERAINSVDTWETIGRVEGSGYSQAPVEYNYTDIDLPKSGGNIFYRLKQVDFSGKYSYSRTRAIQVEAAEGMMTWIAYPNPSLNGSDISIALTRPDLYQDELIYLRLVNMLGNGDSQILTSPDDLSQVVSEWLRSKNTGLYILDIRWGDHTQQIKLLRN